MEFKMLGRPRRSRLAVCIALSLVMFAVLLATCGYALAAYDISATCNADPDIWTFGSTKRWVADYYGVQANIVNNATGGVCLRIVNWDNGLTLDPGHRFLASELGTWQYLTYATGGIYYRYKWRQYYSGSDHYWAGQGRTIPIGD